MAKKTKIPVRVQRLVSKLERGRVVCLTMKSTEAEDARQWWLEPGGNPVGDWTVKKAMDLGLLEPTGDGLFPGESQTWRLAR